MRRLRLGWLAVLASSLCLCAQERYLTDPLQTGRLSVWVVSPAPPPQPTADQVRATLHESTAGNFGQLAGSVGQTAGSYGRTAGQLPSSRATAGQPAGSAGQAAGTFGQLAGSLGQMAGSYGVSAGELGTTATHTKTSPTAPDFVQVTLDRTWVGLQNRLHAAMPDLSVQFLPVSATDLAVRLSLAQSSHALPDILLSYPGIVAAQPPLLGEWVLPSLGSTIFVPEELSGSVPATPPDAFLLAAAPDPDQARAFLVWLRDGERARWEAGWAERVERVLRQRHAPSEHEAEVEDAAKLAAIAAEASLEGSGMAGAADGEALPVDPALVQAEALAPSAPEGLDDLRVRVDVLGAAANGRFAVVMLRGVAASRAAFGVVHSLVVLRRNPDAADKHWRVLQVAPVLPPELLETAFQSLRPFTMQAPAEKVTVPKGVTLASPPDGDLRSPGLELWWDNGGGDQLLVVEWQHGVGAAWGSSHLFFVPDRVGRLQTRVGALFASQPGPYRWRVWALGEGGMVVLSPFRHFVLLP